MNSTFSAWITKYALSQGIIEKEVRVCSTCFNGRMIEAIGDNHRKVYFGEGKDWHRTKESAIKRAEEMKQNRIDYLEKQIAKLKNLKFE